MKRHTSLLLLVLALPAFGQPYYVAPTGNDANPGTLEKPFASLQRAQQAVRQKPGTVFLRGGTYYLPETLVFTAQDSGTQGRAGRFPGLRRTSSPSSAAASGWTSSTGSRTATASSRPRCRRTCDRGNLRQRRAADPGALSELRSQGAILRRLRGGRHLHRTRRALGRSGGRLFPRHAPRALGRLHLAHHRQGRATAK